jgi:flagellar hook-associated protein 3 FlgL
MRISTNMIFQRATSGILDAQSQVSKTQLQMSSGKKVINPSDDPIAAARILQLQHSIDLHNTYQTNIGYAQASLNAEESALNNANNFLQRIRVLAIQAGNGVITSADMQSIAQELHQDLNGLVALANSQDGSGNHLFAGNRTTISPFSQSGGSFIYAGDQAQRSLQIGENRQVDISDSGYKVFQNIKNGNGTFVTSCGAANTGSGTISAGQVNDPAAWVPDTYSLTFTTPSTYEVRDSSSAVVASGSYQSDAPITFNGIQVTVSGTPAAGDSYTIAPSANQDIFTTIQKIINTLNKGVVDPTTRAKYNSDINQFLASIDQGMNHLDNVRAGIGARLNSIDNQKAENSDLVTASQTALSSLQDLDYAAAATRLSQQMLMLQAAQQSFVKVQNLSLFNYIQ